VERLLQRAREAERTVVGCIWARFGPRGSVDTYRACAALCTEADFLDRGARALWLVYGKLEAAGLPFAPATVGPRLAEYLGGTVEAAYRVLADLDNELYMSWHAEEFARIVRSESIRRRLVSGVAECAETAEAPDSTAGAIVEAVQAVATEGALLVAASEPPVLLDSPELMARYIAGGEQANDKQIPTNWRAIQRNGGLLPGELVVVVARPKVGKSALLQNLFADSLGAFTRAGEQRSGLYLSLEMPAGQWWERWTQIVLAQSRGWVNENIRQSGNPDPVYLERLASFKKLAVARPDGRTSVGTLEGLAETHRRQHGRLDLLGIDHFDFMDLSGTPKESSADRIRETYRDLKLLAGRLDCAVVVLHQGSREGGDGTTQPSATSARGSAGPEEVADLMLGAWRPGMEKEDREAQREMNLKAIVARRSPPFMTRLDFDPETLVIRDKED
jgi:replicative DNA helicase